MCEQTEPVHAPLNPAQESAEGEAADHRGDRVASLARWHLVCAFLQIACLGLDRAAGSASLIAGVVVRLALVVPLYLVGALLLSWGPRSLRTTAILVPMLVATGAVAYLGVLAPPPFNDRYTMAAGMIPLLGVILMPLATREATLLTCTAIPVYSLLALSGWSGGRTPVADLVVFMCSLMLFGLHVRYRLARIERANLLLQQREHERAEELGRLSRSLEALSVTDPLTGIANRRGFDLAAAQIWRKCRDDGSWLGLLMIDVDHFKSFNDAAGHLAGDQCLRALVGAMVSSCELERNYLARFGGEEFVVLLPGASPEGTKRYAEGLRAAVVSAAIPNPGRLNASVTVSVGAASIRPGELQSSVNAIVADADEALYSAKKAGRNRTMLKGEQVDHIDYPDRLIATDTAA